ncbi:50S ribosomal protein L3 [Ktedonobacter sp. SOSP1-85]|jgi:large subunit ribosomal protein L3|uniref:Large ribosomal subunit protein uL3 n=1 Tax=Ktedonobacter robiniae TaxID=2778365 RepID=A0ABQ3UMP1_9CHLR|nr:MULTISPECIES: 50S ribosomal protein L3 [Ktedonobacter]GHO53650.1 50S ribosomal protein L3 [Ktedonobacter robiniae]GHO68887.1 50S ribosomal protein L3 [Ktedonobacter sp. SOSP1-52]GHO74748.1 50S ribosomal protein L3 [Ktedonobacter sp. SOSP1-85]
MLDALLGRKVGMTQVFGQNGTVIPVTVIEVGPCIVTQVKTVSRDGYEAVQIGFEETTLKHSTRPELGHLGHSLPLLKGQRKALQTHDQQAKSEENKEEEKQSKQVRKLLKIRENRQRRPGPELGPFKVLREVGLQEGVDLGSIELGHSFNASLFTDGEIVDIVGITKGKGFQGGVKRHGFRGGPRTHGQSDRLRAPGSIGSGTTPGRVLKGTRMAGRMGNARVTVKKLQIVQSDPERNLLVVKGSVPGANGGLLTIKKHVMR